MEFVNASYGILAGIQANGTTQLDQLNTEDAERSVIKACKDAGKEPPSPRGFPKQTDVNAALAANRIDAHMADSPIVDYAVNVTGDAFEKAGEDTDSAPYGIGIPKTGGHLQEALQGAVQELMDDGTYQEILDHWASRSARSSGTSTRTCSSRSSRARCWFGLNEAAYMSEIVRAGGLSVDQGQTEAAQALGMTRLKILRRIVLPQVTRVIIPPTGNETISMLKTRSSSSTAVTPGRGRCSWWQASGTWC